LFVGKRQRRILSVMTFNGGFATASRFLYAAAREDTLLPLFARISIMRAVPYIAVISLSASSAAIAIVIFLTGQFQVLILVGAVLEALIYTVAGLCVLRLRRKQPDAQRAFRIWGGWTIPVLTILVFGVLAILAAIGIGSNLLPGLPLIVTIALFIASAPYVYLVIPRLRAAAQARRATVKRRRPARTETGTSGS
jgi:amino acid transporter